MRARDLYSAPRHEAATIGFNEAVERPRLAERITLRALEAELGDENYPLTREAVLEEYGDVVLDLPGGEEAVADALARASADEFPDHAAVVASVKTGIGGEGVGRRDYTDRGGNADSRQQESF
jgi:hypothetical protein